MDFGLCRVGAGQSAAGANWSGSVFDFWCDLARDVWVMAAAFPWKA